MLTWTQLSVSRWSSGTRRPCVSSDRGRSGYELYRKPFLRGSIWFPRRFANLLRMKLWNVDEVRRRQTTRVIVSDPSVVWRFQNRLLVSCLRRWWKWHCVLGLKTEARCLQWASVRCVCTADPQSSNRRVPVRLTWTRRLVPTHHRRVWTSDVPENSWVYTVRWDLGSTLTKRKRYII